MKTVLGTTCLFAILAAPAMAQSGGGFDLTWSTLPGGGGTSVGGGYTVAGTLGQAEAGSLTGDGFTVAGGFWPGGGTPVCYANCDGSTTPPILTVNDFTCFINEFAAAQALPHEEQVVHYANCDGSTTSPALTVNDFTCFINAFAAGCP